MLCLSTEIKWNVRSLAIAFYTYILHTRIDNEPGDIVFAYYDTTGLKRIIVDVDDDSTFFDMLASSKVVDFSMDELEESSISAIFTNESFCNMDYLRFNVNIIRNSRDITVGFQRDFYYGQQQNFARYYLRIVKYSLEHGDCKVCDYSMLRDDEIYPIIHAFDKTRVQYNEHRLVVDDFYSYYIKDPHKTCIAYQDMDFSYFDIEEQSNRIANMLHNNHISAGDGVIIYMNRSERILSGILGIMKCAAFYLPIDISTPIERVNDIVVDSNIRVVLVDSDDMANRLNGIVECPINVYSSDNENSVLNFDRVTPTPESPCYMIYTSGTTGKPKGVMIKNKNIANFISNNILDDRVKAARIDSPCIIAPNKVGFDAFVGDMLLSLSCGFKIVMASDEELDNPNQFVKAIKRNRVNIIQTTPTRLNISILSYFPEMLNRFKVIVCGGEPLVKEEINKIRHYAPNATLINVYGPTETTVWSAAANVTIGEKGIGFPAQNTRCYILNRYKKFLPDYETGILYIGGDGLGSYCFDPVNQAEKYVQIPGIDEQIYNSGDTAFLDSEKFIIYGARADSQVKINGVRIELGDIESVAKKSSIIKDCAAAVKEIPEIGRRLVLYYTADVKISSGDFRTILSELPDSYIPNYYVFLKKLPLTSSSKIDRKALPLPVIENEEEIVLPKTDMEKIIYDAVNRILEDHHTGQVVSINKPIADYGITSRNTAAIISFMESKGISSNDFRKRINVHKSIFEIAGSFENNDNDGPNTRNFPRYSFDSYADKNHYSCIFLTGAAGFLGSHILASLLKNTKAHIICLYHSSNIEKAYNSYHMDVPYDQNRIDCVYGSLSEENFGLLDEDLELVESADAIINCAAYVKYFGDSERFYKTNVLSVKNLIDFSIKNRIVLNHISTLSVLGTNAKDHITEKDFWFGQNEIFSNQYIESKFLAENEIIKGRENGLKYRIFRVGRLSWRLDGVFQNNCDENEFYSTLKTFETLGMVPEELLDINIEISPIDGCANAIVALMNNNRINGSFHIMNENTVSLRFVIESMNHAGCSIKTVPMEEFMNGYNSLSNVYKDVTNICCVSNNTFSIEHNDFVSNALTIKSLPKSFKWPAIDEQYFKVKFGKKIYE